MKTRTDVSAGGVIVDDAGRVVLTSRRSFKGELQWGLPKGLVEAGEGNETAALREAREETGFEVEVVSPLDTIEYWYVQPARGGSEPVRVHKFVHYFLMRPVGGDPSLHDHETEDVELLDLEQAITRTTFSSEKKLLKGLLEKAVEDR